MHPGSGGTRARQDAGIELSGVTKRFLTPAGTAFTALTDVDLTVEPGQFCAVVGPDRLRQVHHPDPGGRAGPAQRRHGPRWAASR